MPEYGKTYWAVMPQVRALKSFEENQSVRVAKKEKNFPRLPVVLQRDFILDLDFCAAWRARDCRFVVFVVVAGVLDKHS